MKIKWSDSPSLKFRLVAGTLAIVGLIWIAVTVFAWHSTVHESDEVFDAHLAQTATLLLALAGNEASEIAEHLPEHRYVRKVAFQIWDGATLLAHSSGAPQTPLGSWVDGFSESTIRPAIWRVFSLSDPETGYRVFVAESLHAREAISHELTWHLLAPLLIALPILALALIMMIRANLAPLSRLASNIAERSADRLDSVPLTGVLRETIPLIVQLNHLFARLGLSFEKERRFTADAAHELRTPLAAIRAHAQVALGEEQPIRRQAALGHVIEGTDRVTHLVEQLLTLARLDAAQVTTHFASCDLRFLAIEAVAQCTPSAFAKAVELELAEGVPVSVRGDAILLSVLLRNLIDNAVCYSPSGTSVTVDIAHTPDGVVLRVIDQGPGISSAERERVLQRFVRLPGNQASGAGLGLSIVARIAELHGARLCLDEAPRGGLVVTVTFP